MYNVFGRLCFSFLYANSTGLHKAFATLIFIGKRRKKEKKRNETLEKRGPEGGRFEFLEKELMS